MTFTFMKYDKKGTPNVDQYELHSTHELHYATSEVVKCGVCDKEFIDGNACKVLPWDGKMVVAHQACPKTGGTTVVGKDYDID